MPRGGKRPGVGRPAKTLAELQLTGGFRMARHAYLLTSPAPVAPRSIPVPNHVLAGLNERGRAFAERTWQAFADWNPVTEVLLREAAILMDEVDALRGQKSERACQRLLVSVLSALRLED
jgi:hypothetical protein